MEAVSVGYFIVMGWFKLLAKAKFPPIYGFIVRNPELGGDSRQFCQLDGALIGGKCNQRYCAGTRIITQFLDEFLIREIRERRIKKYQIRRLTPGRDQNLLTCRCF